MRDFIKSEYCPDCEGSGFRIEKTSTGPFGEDLTEYEQCETCEELHKQEVYVDIMQDEAKE